MQADGNECPDVRRLAALGSLQPSHEEQDLRHWLNGRYGIELDLAERMDCESIGAKLSSKIGCRTFHLSGKTPTMHQPRSHCMRTWAV
eukprot:12928201-Prorocentrum_lima.AAC.1